MRRIAAWFSAGILILALFVGLASYAYLRGWHVERLPAAEISALLRPHDEILMPHGDGPFTTVLLFHGCGGKTAHEKEWARSLREGVMRR